MLAYYYFVFVVFADHWLLSFGVGTSVIQSADCNCLFSKCSVAVVILKYDGVHSFARWRTCFHLHSSFHARDIFELARHICQLAHACKLQ